jgi:hypothetical protein
MLCSLVIMYPNFRGIFCLHHHGRLVSRVGRNSDIGEAGKDVGQEEASGNLMEVYGP